MHKYDWWQWLFFGMLLIGGFQPLISCGSNKGDEPKPKDHIGLVYVSVGEQVINPSVDNTGVSVDQLIQLRFNKGVTEASAQNAIRLSTADGGLVELTLTFLSNQQLVKASHPILNENTEYTLTISNELEGINGELFESQTYTFTTVHTPLVVKQTKIDQQTVVNGVTPVNVALQAEMELVFNVPVLAADVSAYTSLQQKGVGVNVQVMQKNDSTVLIKPVTGLMDWMQSELSIASGLSTKVKRPFNGFSLPFYTVLDSTNKFPIISDDELLTLVQEQTFKYFWDFAHPNSGLARERNTSGDVVTSGGSGFGLMALIVGVERGFITREQAVERFTTIVDFLAQADRFHGAWSHWLDGNTGKARPFSTKDNGGDLVETSFLAAGLLAVRQYLNGANYSEQLLIDKINVLWNGIEWDWYTRGGQNVLYWHWSPDYNWDMNMKISGYNEALITYVLAASSTNHPVNAQVYHEGWARNGAIKNGNSYYNHQLPLGYEYGGPLFFSHYSFMGLDPRKLSDTYANYWTQNVQHSLINQAHSIQNPKGFVGYSHQCWGLTASDNHQGYSAHSPTNDLGVITPTAALSSMPYTPEQSMAAMRFFYYQLGDKLWGDYGFYDAFNPSEGWTASSYLAIDQGPIVVMIENYRTGLIWDLLMSCSEVQQGLTKLGFNY